MRCRRQLVILDVLDARDEQILLEALFESRDERIEELGKTDENFRQLTEIVKRDNGGRIPSSAEIDAHIEGWRERHERRASS